MIYDADPAIWAWIVPNRRAAGRFSDALDILFGFRIADIQYHGTHR